MTRRNHILVACHLVRAFQRPIKNALQCSRQYALNNLAVASEFAMDAEVDRIGAHLARHMPIPLTGRTGALV